MQNTEKKQDRLIVISGILWALSFVICLGVVKEVEMPTGLGVVVAILPALGFAWFLYNFLKGAKVMDELERRIQLEAMAVAFCLGLLLLMILGLLDQVVTLSQDDWSYRHLVPFFFIFYCFGVFLARRRYA